MIKRTLWLILILLLTLGLTACNGEETGGNDTSTSTSGDANDSTSTGDGDEDEDSSTGTDTSGEDIATAEDSTTTDTGIEDTGVEETTGHPCDDSCGVLWLCTQSDDGSGQLCPGIPPESEADFIAVCLQNPICELLGTLLGDGSHAACASGLDTFKGLSPEFAPVCDGQ